MIGKTRLLRYRKLGNQRYFTARSLNAYARTALPVGAHYPEVEFIPSDDGEMLVASITALMLAEHAGDAETVETSTTLTYEAPLQPWWLPDFLWKRIEWEPRHVSRKLGVTVQPVWKFPHAPFVPELGEGLRGVEVYHHITDEEIVG